MTRLIAEWEQQYAILLTWPHRHSSWESTLDDIEAVYRELVLAIAAHQRVIILCYNKSEQKTVKTYLNLPSDFEPQVSFVDIATNDTWIRDYGPLSLMHDGEITLINFQFNAWGNKYNFRLDNKATDHLRTLKTLPYPIHDNALIMEGGSLETDGEGTLLTTSQCLLSPSRNPHLNKESITKILQETMGITRIHWLDHGHLAGDDTDSHIDMLARFCSPTHICYLACDDPTDEHYESLQAMANELQQLRTVDNKPYQLTALPWPTAKYDDGKRLAASYANFLIINNAVIVPTYDDAKDAEALQIIQSCFPNRQIIGIPSIALIRQCGSIHCATMQIAQSHSLEKN